MPLTETKNMIGTKKEITQEDILIGKILLLTLNEQKEKAIDKIIAALSDCISFEPMQITPASVLSFPGLEIKQSQHRVFQDGEEINLTRLEYSTLASRLKRS